MDAYRAFRFRLGKRESWASSWIAGDPEVSLTINAAVEVRVPRMTPAEARAMAAALFAAADDAEARLPTGLGESVAA